MTGLGLGLATFRLVPITSTRSQAPLSTSDLMHVSKELATRSPKKTILGLRTLVPSRSSLGRQRRQ